jgi:hypothetical protein
MVVASVLSFIGTFITLAQCGAEIMFLKRRVLVNVKKTNHEEE